MALRAPAFPSASYPSLFASLHIPASTPHPPERAAWAALPARWRLTAPSKNGLMGEDQAMRRREGPSVQHKGVDLSVQRKHCGGWAGRKVMKPRPYSCHIAHPLSLSWPRTPRLPRPPKLLRFFFLIVSLTPHAQSSRESRPAALPGHRLLSLLPGSGFTSSEAEGGGLFHRPEGLPRFARPLSTKSFRNRIPGAARALRPHRSKGILKVSNIAARTEGWASSAERARADISH